MTFQELNLIEPIRRALQEEGYENPTPIQAQSIPQSLNKRDLLACAQTGTGKTAAFAIPILQILHEEHITRKKPKQIRALILTPTRELAIQIEESFRAYGRHMRLRSIVVFGGVSQGPQVDSLKKEVDILIATPGRLLDLMNQGIISLQEIEIFVLDEADRMLDMGFIHDVRRVIRALPVKRQTLFFSATMPAEIAELAHDILSDPVKVAVTPVSSTAERIDQSVFFVPKKGKKNLLVYLLNNKDIQSALVFTRTKHGANRVAKDLTRDGIRAMAIHGNKSQSARQQALQQFKNGEIKVLVATDIAARGIDVEELSHVINYDLPNIPETYVHRIGRTGRAGASGIAFSFCDAEERPYLSSIQRLIGIKIPVIADHPFVNGSPDQEEPSYTEAAAAQNDNARPARNDRNRENSRSSNPRNRNQRSANNRNRRGPNKGPVEPRRKENTETRKEVSPPQNAPEKKSVKEKQEGSADTGNTWSSSIFQKPSTGKKGFVIKSDRDDKPRPKSGRPPFRGGKKK